MLLFRAHSFPFTLGGKDIALSIALSIFFSWIILINI